MRRQNKKGLARQKRLSRYAAKKTAKFAKFSRSAITRISTSLFGNYSVIAPKDIRFHGNEETRNTFRMFVNAVTTRLRMRKSVQIDFSKVEVLHPCGVLLLLSHVRNWEAAFPGLVSATYPTDEVVEQMLQSVEILQKLGLSNRLIINREEVTRWFYFKGDSVDASPIAPFMTAAQVRLGITDQSVLYDSVVEAITNVTHHAYDGAEKKRWWMFASLTSTHVIVSILDSGKSIPGTLLEKPKVREQVRKWMWGRKGIDGRVLHAAMGGRSRTQLAHRGKGLPEMLESTKRTFGSSLAIYSRRAMFFCESVKDREERGQMNEPIDGTLLLWSLMAPEGTRDARN